jgi:integrase
MSVWKSRNKWFYKFRHNGQPIVSNKGFETQADARLAQAEKKVQLSKMPAIRLDFVRLCEDRLRDLKQKRGKWYLSDNTALTTRLIESEGWGLKKEITEADVTDFLDKVADEISPQRANKYLAYLKALFSHGIKRKLIEGSPAFNVDRYPENRKPKYVPPEADILKVLLICRPEQRDYLWTLALTAARCGEINSLAVASVNLDHGYITLSTRKAKDGVVKYRRINIGVTLREILARRIKAAEEAGSKYVFFHPATAARFNYRSKFLRNKCEDAGVPVFTYHSLRHFAAVTMDREGIPLTDIQAVLGHDRTTTTDIYLSSIQAARPLATNALEAKLRDKYVEAEAKGKKDRKKKRVASEGR